MAATFSEVSISVLVDALREARARTIELIADLDDAQMIGPRLSIVNPLRWEVGHVAYFQEYWVLRHRYGRPPIIPSADTLYDSARVAHDLRWDLDLPSKKDTLGYMREVLEHVCDAVCDGARSRVQVPMSEDEARVPLHDDAYFLTLSLLHECMHAEAITYTRQTHGYPAPEISIACGCEAGGHAVSSPVPGDAHIPGGAYLLGSVPNSGFTFDNEQWAHLVNLKPFDISRTAVSNVEFAAFVESCGYQRREFWCPDGWRWREAVGALHPVYWKRDGSQWLRRNFDRMKPLEPDHPVIHVNWYEADAYCRWAGRRLPSEAEWEVAASAVPDRRLDMGRRTYPWGQELPRLEQANLNWRVMGCVGVADLAAGDSAFGCRQMIGNVWEWTATDFRPYPGFSPGPYKEYSAPWFGDHKVLRGGCWATRSFLIRNTYRNFYKPDRRDVWAGLRTCALHPAQ